jgi:hypothetical protein
MGMHHDKTHHPNLSNKYLLSWEKVQAGKLRFFFCVEPMIHAYLNVQITSSSRKRASWTWSSCFPRSPCLPAPSRKHICTNVAGPLLHHHVEQGECEFPRTTPRMMDNVQMPLWTMVDTLRKPPFPLDRFPVAVARSTLLIACACSRWGRALEASLGTFICHGSATSGLQSAHAEAAPKCIGPEARAWTDGRETTSRWFFFLKSWVVYEPSDSVYLSHCQVDIARSSAWW